ncbi:MAG: GNAT family N-acetyltransferase [Dehalococcoidia bacterium]
MTGARGQATPHDQLVVADAGPFRIRRKHRDDLADDYAWRRDPETARFDGALPLGLTFEQYVREMEQELIFGLPGRASFSIDAPGGEHIGNVMYYNASQYGDAAELGISIGREEWRGKGAGTAVVVAFLRFLWATTAFRRVVLHTLTWNDRARRCFERAGFAALETVLHNNEPHLLMEARREWWLLWDSEGRF